MVYPFHASWMVDMGLITGDSLQPTARKAQMFLRCGGTTAVADVAVWVRD
jgi:hypothetical protein